MRFTASKVTPRECSEYYLNRAPAIPARDLDGRDQTQLLFGTHLNIAWSTRHSPLHDPFLAKRS
jgi:hypothetical protein